MKKSNFTEPQFVLGCVNLLLLLALLVSSFSGRSAQSRSSTIARPSPTSVEQHEFEQAITKANSLTTEGTYITKETILRIYDQMAEGMRG